MLLTPLRRARAMKTANRQAGDYDRSFGEQGIVELPPFFNPLLPRNFTGMALQGDSILVAALAFDERGGRHCGIIRLDKDGKHDQSFGENGVVAGRFSPNEHAQPETLLSLEDGTIVILGFSADPQRPFPQPKFLMLSRNGQGPGVAFNLDIPEGSAMVIGSGRLAASISHFMIAFNLYTTPGLPQPKSRIYRLDDSGSPGFPHDSFIEIEFALGEHEMTGLVQSADGFFVAGTHSIRDRAEGFIARYNNAGELDQSFGRNGFITFDVHGQPTWIKALVQRPDGSLIVLGNAQIDAKSTAFVWQFTAQGEADPNFNNANPVVDDAVAVWHNAALDADGRLVTFGRGHALVHKRYRIDGSPDADYIPPDDHTGIEDAMMCLPHGTNTLLAWNATAANGMIGTIAAIQNDSPKKVLHGLSA